MALSPSGHRLYLPTLFLLPNGRRVTQAPPLLGYFFPPSLDPCVLVCLSLPLLFLPCPCRCLAWEATLTSCCEAHGEKTLSSSKDTGLPLCSRWMIESSSGSKVTALVASGPSPSSLVTGRTRAITRIFPRLIEDGEMEQINCQTAIPGRLVAQESHLAKIPGAMNYQSLRLLCQFT